MGPITPPSKSGNRYMLSVVDHATRYPEAVALKRVDAVITARGFLGYGPGSESLTKSQLTKVYSFSVRSLRSLTDCGL